MQTTNKHTGYIVQSSLNPSLRKSLDPKHENRIPECPSSQSESTAQASCLAVMRFGDYHSNEWAATINFIGSKYIESAGGK